MSNITAKLILLQQAEGLISAGWPRGIQPALIKQVEKLREEISAEMVASYDELKRQSKMPVVAAVLGMCQGCRSPLSQTTRTELDCEETVCCPHCGCYLYSSEPSLVDGFHADPLVTSGQSTGSIAIPHRP